MRSRLDPVTLEVIRNAMPAISNEMSYDLQRTSYNMMIYEVCDYSCTLLDTDGNADVAEHRRRLALHRRHGRGDQGRHRTGMAWRISPKGDVLITNHQAVAGQHLNNIVIYTPFFLDGVLTAFPAVRAHWVDVGGLSTGFGALGSTDAWSEGLQLNQLKIYEAGKPDNKLLQVISDNIRFPQAAMGDLRSQIAACRLAERRLEELYKRYGAETIAAAMEIIYSETERKCRAVVETIPDGVYEADNYVDAPGAKEPLVHIHVKVTVSGSDMEIDFTGTQPQTAGNNNSRTLAAAYIAYKGLTTPLEPANEGSFRALKAIVPEGCIMMASYPGGDGGLGEPDSGLGRRGVQGARAGDPGTHSGRPLRLHDDRTLVHRLRSAARQAASCCRRSTVAAGAGVRRRMVRPDRSRSARATCATRRSKASSRSVR